MPRTASRGRTHHSFAQLPSVSMPRSRFNRSSGLKTTFDSGYLIPVYVDECLPGDTFNMDMSSFVRMATPIFPVMDDFFLDCFFFAVPNRLVWDNWERFNGAKDNPTDSTDYRIPTVTPLTVNGNNELYDYMGLPNSLAPVEVNALPFRALNLIYNEWFRSQDLQDSLPVPKDNGPDDPTNYKLFRRTKRHDYFTSALPAPQKGPAIPIIFEGTVPVTPVGGVGASRPIFEWGGGAQQSGLGLQSGQGSVTHFTDAGAQNTSEPVFWNTTNLEAVLDEATSNNINQLRIAFQTQRLLERDSRGGTRYTEILRSHFGVISPDARLQRPEYLGGSSTRINVSPVAQTVDSGTTAPEVLGRLGGFVTASDRCRFIKSFTEHCYLIGLVNVRSKVTYQQGLERLWNRRDRFEFYWPAFSRLGEQAIVNKELFWDSTAEDEETFGFIPRYDEYRYKPSRVSGKMKSNLVAGSLDAWHLAVNFGTERPRLNATFIEEKAPFDRVIAVPSEPQFIADFHFSLVCSRPMPVHAVPGLIDHL